MLIIAYGMILAFLALLSILVHTVWRRRYQSLAGHLRTEIDHLLRTLREKDQYQDALLQQHQKCEQKLEALQTTFSELSRENAKQKSELNFLQNVQLHYNQQRQHIEELIAENSGLKATLRHEKTQTEEKINLLQDTSVTLQTQFKNLSAEIFQQSHKNFLELAGETLKASMEKSHSVIIGSLDKKEQAIQALVNPIQQALGQVDGKIQALEKERIGAYEGLKTQIHHLMSNQKELRFETANLVKALRTPHVRGKWGEMQLRRVVEFSGMVSHCDFIEQSSTTTEMGRLRPDMIINLPGQSQIIVDAKAPLSAYLDAIESVDENLRLQKLQDHARHVRGHIKALSQKAYHEQFEKSPDFVILFLPGEMFFSAALEQDPELLEMGFKNNVILAHPTSLMTLLRTVGYGWRQESLAENAKKIGKLGQELSKRISDLASHMLRLGKNISSVVDSYNQTVGTLERRVLVSARKFKDYDQHSEHIEDLFPLSNIPREIQALELISDSGQNDLVSENLIQGPDDPKTPAKAT